MKSRPWIMPLVLASSLLLITAWRVRTYQLSSDRLGAKHALVQTTHADLQTILNLRASDEQMSVGRRPDQDVIARVNATLADAGLPTSVFGGQSPEADTALAGSTTAGPTYRRQSVRVSLKGLRVDQLGSFLIRWRDTQPTWIPSRVEMTHERGRPDSPLYDVTILLSCLYLETP